MTYQDEDARKLQLVLAQRPSLLQNICDETGGLEMNVDRMPAMTARDRIMQDSRKARSTKQRSFCSCSTITRERGTSYSMGAVRLSKSSMASSKHSASCPLYIGTEATTTIELKMTYYGRLLANTVRATISFTNGAGGVSISPCLRLRAMVSNSSPAFQLLDEKTLDARFGRTQPSQPNELCEYFESALQQLYELFQAKVASPTDINEDGETLITVSKSVSSERLDTDACEKILCRSSNLLVHYHIEAFQSFRTLLMGLVAVGVPLNETGVSGS